MENILYKDRRITITRRKIVFAQKTIELAAIRAISLEQVRDTSAMYRTLAYGSAWGIFCVILNFTPIPTVFLFFAAGLGIWWLFERIWPYTVFAETRNGKEIVFSSHNKKQAEEIAQLLCKILGIE